MYFFFLLIHCVWMCRPRLVWRARRGTCVQKSALRDAAHSAKMVLILLRLVRSVERRGLGFVRAGGGCATWSLCQAKRAELSVRCGVKRLIMYVAEYAFNFVYSNVSRLVDGGKNANCFV